MAKSIMIQGTMSNAGKSFLVAGICRILRQDGYRVAPFKSQNMALNSYITEDGLEMGRAQVMQAEACGVEPTVYMNPILLKPTTDVGSQVIVNGIPQGNMRASDYFKYKTQLIPDILNAWRKLSEEYDVIVIEGAGSPAEINLKKNDIVNMGLAELVDAPVLLVGDIDRGGVFAQLMGTLALLEEPERQRIRGFVMNKFRGDVEILRPGLDMLWERCHVETVGVIPYTYLDLDDEDSLSERLSGERQEKDVDKNMSRDPKNNIGGQDRKTEADVSDDSEKTEKLSCNHVGVLKIAIIRLPRISNFTDFNVLQAMDGVKVTYVSKISELGEPHMVILPGTKSTIADMRWFRESGLEAAVLKLHSRGVTIFGICGGFQMLGRKISDPLGAESEKEEFYEVSGKAICPETGAQEIGVIRETKESESVRSAGNTMREKDGKKLFSSITGMGLLPFETLFQGEKVRKRVTGRSGKFTGDYAEASEKKFSGYEIHMGRTEGGDEIRKGQAEPETAAKIETQGHENKGTMPGEDGQTDVGLIYQKGNVFGTYVHGIFDEQEFRESFLSVVAKRNNINLAAQTVSDYRAYRESQYDKLADVVRGGMDMKKLYEIIGLRPNRYFPGENENCEIAIEEGHANETATEEGHADEYAAEERNAGEIAGSAGNKEESIKEHKKGYLHLYYGDGKGKTTAAVGLAIRAAGAGKRVVFCQFLKSGESGELSVLGSTPGIRILRSTEKFGFSWTLSEEEKTRLRRIHTDLFREAMRLVEAGRCDVLILDEICDALRKKLMDDALFYRYLKTVGERDGKGTGYRCEWILTGRDPDERILAAADYVTQMKKERHPFDDGVKARRGIEF